MPAHLPRVKSRLSLHAHRKVQGLLEGEYAAQQTGRSMDFNDLREYVRGDDVKDLDWKASARTRTLLVKRYVAIRKHTVLLVVSTGNSMAASNSLATPKRDLAVFVAGVMGYLAVNHGDFVSLAYGDRDRQHVIPPGNGELRLERCLGAIHDATSATSGESDLPAVLRHVARTVKRRTVMVIVSDDYQVDDELSAALRRLCAQHEVLFCSIGDLDPTLADREVGRRSLVDVVTGHDLPAWLRGDDRLAQEYADLVAGQTARFRRDLETVGVVHERVHDDRSAVRAIFRLLERHRHAKR